MWMLNTGKPTKIPPLNDAMVIELGANILGEVIIFVIAAVIIIMEVARQRRKEENKERLRREELDRLKYEVVEIMSELSRHENEIAGLFEIIQNLEKSKNKNKTKNTSREISPKQHVRPQPPSKPPPPSPTRFPTVSALSASGASTISASSLLDPPGSSPFVSVASLSFTMSQFLSYYIQTISMLTSQLDGTRVKILTAPLRNICDFNAIYYLLVNDEVVMSDQSSLECVLYIIRDVFYKQKNYLIENKSDICLHYLENKDGNH